MISIYYLAHIVGDFYFQSPRMAKAKKTILSEVLKHCFIYGIPLLILFIVTSVYPGLNIRIRILIFMFVTHAIIDLLKFKLEKFLYSDNFNIHIQDKDKFGLWSFQIDQLLHIFCILFSIHLFQGVRSEFKYGSVISLILFLSIAMKPLNIYLLLLTNKFIVNDKTDNLENNDIDTLESSETKNDDNKGSFIKECRSEIDDTTPKEELGIVGAGKFIGALERVLYSIFLVSGLFSGIALVVSVKAFARYDKVAKSVKFAEYFTIGTLTSLLLTIITYSLISIVDPNISTVLSFLK